MHATALIADDEPHLARALGAELTALWPELSLLAAARNGIEAAQRIAQEQPDIAFLDIQMPGLTGLEVAQGIEGLTRVVFVTAYDAFAVQAFEQAALDYVLKPVARQRLQQTVLRVQRALADGHDSGAGLAAVMQRLASPVASSDGARMGTNAGTNVESPLRWIRASAGELTHQISVDDVLYFHADDKYTCVQTAQAEHLIRTPIAELAQQLDARAFWQIHRSTIVNVSHLAGTRRDDASRLFVRVKGATGAARELPVSRAYVQLFKAM